MSVIIRSESDFLGRLISIADNFKWQMSGTQIYAFKGELFFDPLTAYVQIAKGEYIARHHSDEIPGKAAIHPFVFRNIMKALYGPDHADPQCVKLRRDIIDACGIPT